MFPLGVLAFVIAVLTAFFAISYFLSPLAYLAGPLAVGLGALARGDDRSRPLGTVAVVISLLSLLAATIVILTTE